MCGREWVSGYIYNNDNRQAVSDCADGFCDQGWTMLVQTREQSANREWSQAEYNEQCEHWSVLDALDLDSVKTILSLNIAPPKTHRRCKSF